MGLIDKLKKSGFSFNKSLGQNFIVDEGFLSSVVSDMGISKDDTVIEVGTGAGTFTRVLSSFAKQVYTFEVDKRLEQVLKSQFEGLDNIELVFADALKYDMDSVVIEGDSGAVDGCGIDGRTGVGSSYYKLIANIPYYITTPLLIKFIQDPRCSEICVLVQEELANRVIASCGTKDYGALSVTMQAWGRCKILKRVPRHIFTPVPAVDSAFVQIIRHSAVGSGDISDINTIYSGTLHMGHADFMNFSNLVKGSFSGRRKTVANSLANYLGSSRQVAEKYLRAVNIDAGLRPENIPVNKYLELAKKCQKV